MLENASAGATQMEDQCVQQKESCQMESIKDSLSLSIEVLGDTAHVLTPRITGVHNMKGNDINENSTLRQSVKVKTLSPRDCIGQSLTAENDGQLCESHMENSEEAEDKESLSSRLKVMLEEKRRRSSSKLGGRWRLAVNEDGDGTRWRIAGNFVQQKMGNICQAAFRWKRMLTIGMLLFCIAIGFSSWFLWTDPHLGNLKSASAILESLESGIIFGSAASSFLPSTFEKIKGKIIVTTFSVVSCFKDSSAGTSLAVAIIGLAAAHFLCRFFFALGKNETGERRPKDNVKEGSSEPESNDAVQDKTLGNNKRLHIDLVFKLISFLAFLSMLVLLNVQARQERSEYKDLRMVKFSMQTRGREAGGGRQGGHEAGVHRLAIAGTFLCVSCFGRRYFFWRIDHRNENKFCPRYR